MYITWKTGSGKSSLIEQRVYHMRERYKDKCTIIVLDPHGDTVEKIRKFSLAKKYFESHIYIDPTLSKGHTPTINPLECWDKKLLDIEIKSNQLVRAIEEMIPDVKLSNHMRAILKPCIFVLLTLHTSTFEDLQEFLWENNQERVAHGQRCEVKAFRNFFLTEFNNPMYSRTKQSIYTKIQSLLNSQVFYHMTIGKSTINLHQEIKKGKVILCNLSKGKMWEEVAEVLWRFLIAQIKSIALLRAKLPLSMRKPIYLVIDEADTFIKGDSLNVILKETRKYWLHLILATQNIVSGKEQEKLKRNLINNTNVKLIGANGLATLKALSNETWIPVDALQDLGFHQFRVKYGAKQMYRIHTKDVFWCWSPLLLSQGEMISQTYNMVHNTDYYKPILKHSQKPEEWIDDFPFDMQEEKLKEWYPMPKFA